MNSWNLRSRLTDRSKLGPTGLAVIAAAIATVLVVPTQPTATAAAPYPSPVMTGYVPLDADATRATMLSANSAASSTLDFTVGITNAGSGAVMFYDHWEDGYEPDITNPVQASTQVWGDGDPVGGNAASFCGTRCAGDLLPAGAVFVLRNNIPIPRTTTVLWDGRDRVAFDTRVHDHRRWVLDAIGFCSRGLGLGIRHVEVGYGLLDSCRRGHDTAGRDLRCVLDDERAGDGRQGQHTRRDRHRW